MYAVLRQALWTCLTFVCLLNQTAPEMTDEVRKGSILHYVDLTTLIKCYTVVLLPKSQPEHACTRQWDFVGVSTHREKFQLIKQD